MSEKKKKKKEGRKKEGTQEGANQETKEGRKERRKEGRKEGANQETKEGRNEGRKQGRKEQGRKERVAPGFQGATAPTERRSLGRVAQHHAQGAGDDARTTSHAISAAPPIAFAAAALPQSTRPGTTTLSLARAQGLFARRRGSCGISWVPAHRTPPAVRTAAAVGCVGRACWWPRSSLSSKQSQAQRPAARGLTAAGGERARPRISSRAGLHWGC